MREQGGRRLGATAQMVSCAAALCRDGSATCTGHHSARRADRVRKEPTAVGGMLELALGAGTPGACTVRSGHPHPRSAVSSNGNQTVHPLFHVAASGGCPCPRYPPAHHVSLEHAHAHQAPAAPAADLPLQRTWAPCQAGPSAGRSHQGNPRTRSSPRGQLQPTSPAVICEGPGSACIRTLSPAAVCRFCRARAVASTAATM